MHTRVPECECQATRSSGTHLSMDGFTAPAPAVSGPLGWSVLRESPLSLPSF